MSKIQDRSLTNPSSDKESYYFREIQKHGKKYQHFDWPSVETLLNLVLANDAFQTYFSELLAPYRLSSSAFNVLTILSRKSEKACYLSELSELLLVSRANITGLIDTLAKQDRVLRQYLPEDRRKCQVRITAAGEKLLREILPRYYKKAKSLTAVFNAREKKDFCRLMERLRESLKTRDDLCD